ncbi:MAG: HD domain-containing protein [Clostridia bacterium]|nr:HD domain-containing protein [Clostridia bacterium]
MEKEQREQFKEQFLQIARENIKREGIEELLKYLETTDFFEAPASSKFHSAEAGGLCMHSINVYKRMLFLAEHEFGEENVNKETIAICGLFHDVCKANFYREEMRNVKENGEWVQKPYYAVDEQLPYGHGEKSVYIVNGFMRLTREEALAINWHMGGFDKRVLGGDQSFSKAYYKYPICAIMHLADVMATYLDEVAPN